MECKEKHQLKQSYKIMRGSVNKVKNNQKLCVEIANDRDQTKVCKGQLSAGEKFVQFAIPAG